MPKEPITVDAATWTGILPTPWPSPDDYAFPRPLRIGLSPRKQLVMGFGLLALSLLSAKEAFAPVKPGILHWAVMVLGAVASAIGGAFVLFKQYPRKVSCRPIIELSAQGLSIPWWFKRTVPWSEIIHAVYTRPLEEGMPRLAIWGIGIVVREEARFQPTNARAIDVGGLIGKMLQHFLDTSPRELFLAIQAHRAHFGRGGRPADVEQN